MPSRAAGLCLALRIVAGSCLDHFMLKQPFALVITFIPCYKAGMSTHGALPGGEMRSISLRRSWGWSLTIRKEEKVTYTCVPCSWRRFHTGNLLVLGHFFDGLVGGQLTALEQAKGAKVLAV